MVERMATGRRLVITSDHGYAASGMFADVGDKEQVNWLKTNFGSSRFATALPSRTTGFHRSRSVCRARTEQISSLSVGANGAAPAAILRSRTADCRCSKLPSRSSRFLDRLKP